MQCAFIKVKERKLYVNTLDEWNESWVPKMCVMTRKIYYAKRTENVYKLLFIVNVKDFLLYSIVKK